MKTMHPRNISVATPLAVILLMAQAGPGLAQSGGVQVNTSPLALTGTRENVNPLLPPGSGRCAPQYFNTVVIAPGKLSSTGTSNVGSFVSDQSHCLLSAPPTSYVDGKFTWTFAGGDTLTGTYSGNVNSTATPGSFQATEDLVITGGTGRFVGASGTISDAGPLSLANGTGTFKGAFTGTLNATTTTASGAGAVAIGVPAAATGAQSTAIGAYSLASGTQSSAVGAFAVASANNATAVGGSASALASGAGAFGSGSVASGQNSTAIGVNVQATQLSSSAFGDLAAATGIAATAERPQRGVVLEVVSALAEARRDKRPRVELGAVVRMSSTPRLETREHQLARQAARGPPVEHEGKHRIVSRAWLGDPLAQ